MDSNSYSDYFGVILTGNDRAQIDWSPNSIILEFLYSMYRAFPLWCHVAYTRKNARSVTAFNSTDIRAEQDNVATPVTAMMATVCISTDIRPATELMW